MNCPHNWQICTVPGTLMKLVGTLPGCWLLTPFCMTAQRGTQTTCTVYAFKPTWQLHWSSHCFCFKRYFTNISLRLDSVTLMEIITFDGICRIWGASRGKNMLLWLKSQSSKAHLFFLTVTLVEQWQSVRIFWWLYKKYYKISHPFTN